MLSALLVALAYMLGIGFGLHPLVSWAKEEMVNVFGNLIIFIGIVGVVYFFAALAFALSTNGLHTMTVYNNATCLSSAQCGNGYSCDAGACVLKCEKLVGSPQGNTIADSAYHIKCAQKVLSMSQAAITKQTNEIMSVVMRLAFLSKFSRGVGFGSVAQVFYYKYNIFAGVSMITDTLQLLIDNMAWWISSMVGQQFILQMVQQSIFPLFLAIGLLLRTFFITRKLGGLLIAIALCTYTVYPLLYLALANSVVIDPSDLWYDQWDTTWCTCSKQMTYGFDTGLTAVSTRPWWAGTAPIDSADEFSNHAGCPVRICSASVVILTVFGGLSAATDALGLVSAIGSVSSGSIDAGGMPAGSLTTTLHMQYGLLGMDNLDWVFHLFDIVGSLVAPAVIVPFICIFVTLASIKGVANAIGGDTTLSGLERFI